jgi:hypothetical protein
MKAISPRSAVDSVRQHTPALPLALLPLLSAGGSPVTIENSGNIQAEGPTAFGIRAKAYGANSPISVTNSGDIDPVTGIDVRTYGDHSPIAVDNSGDIEAIRRGILAVSYGANSTVTITNSSTVALTGASNNSNAAIVAAAFGPNSNLVIANSGSLQGFGARGIGIYALTQVEGV